MKIVHVSGVDDGNGAAIAAARLHRSLLRLGHDSSMYVGRKLGNDPTVIAFQPPTDLASRVRAGLRDRQIIRGLDRYKTRNREFDDDRTRWGSRMLAQVPPADIINVQSAVGFVDHQKFFSVVPKRVPIVQTLHDMSVLTGGCRFAQECGKYTSRCGACVQLGSNKENDTSRQIWQRKHIAFTDIPRGRLHVVTPSHWLGHEAKRSSLLQRFPVTVIPLGLDLTVFRPRNRHLAREVLGISTNAHVILFVAHPVTRTSKGLTFLSEALERLGLPDLLLLTVGGGVPPEQGVSHLHLGHVWNERLLSFVYSAADIFAIPSLYENFPQTALQALACGIPVVGFDAGGTPEIVRPNTTGLLVPPRDVTGLSDAINELLADPTRRAEMAANGRRIAEEEYTLELAAQRYVKLYQTIVAGNGAGVS